MLHIACVDNIAAAGYHLTAPEWPVTWHYGPPSSVYEAAALGACDAALAPVGSLLELAQHFEPLGRYGIGCCGPVQSVQLFARMPIRSLIMTRQPVFATPQSKTSRKLLVTLCEMEFGQGPEFTTDSQSAEGVLLIGEEALRHSRLRPGWPTRRDLGKWWRDITQLPFVFARWVVRRDLPQHGRKMIASWLERCIEHCGTDAGRADLQARMVSAGFPADIAGPYFARIQYALTMEHLAGEREFLSRRPQEAAWAANE